MTVGWDESEDNDDTVLLVNTTLVVAVVAGMVTDERSLENMEVVGLEFVFFFNDNLVRDGCQTKRRSQTCSTRDLPVP